MMDEADKPNDADEALDERMEGAISRRLGKLAGMPVDTSRMERALRAKLPPVPVARGLGLRRWIWTSAAAALLVLAGSLALVMLEGREAQASPAMMAQLHEDMVSGRIMTIKVDTIDEADRAIAAMAGDFPKLPAPPGEMAMACCMKDVGNKKVACILLANGGVPVTMAVASAKDMNSPRSPTVERDGVVYHVEEVGKLHMVMTKRQDKWICLVSSASAETLMDLAGRIKQ